MSYEFDTPPGATITCVFLMILVISLFGTMIKKSIQRNKVEVSESLSSRFFEIFLYFYGMLTARGKAEYSDCTKKLEDKNVR